MTSTSDIARAMSAMRRTRAGGRPRTVPCSGEQTCRCADCRVRRGWNEPPKKPRAAVKISLDSLNSVV